MTLKIRGKYLSTLIIGNDAILRHSYPKTNYAKMISNNYTMYAV